MQTEVDRLARLDEIRHLNELYEDRDWHDHIHWLLKEIDTADQADDQAAKLRAVAPGLLRFLTEELPRGTINPVAAHARMWANTIATLLDIENDGAGD